VRRTAALFIFALRRKFHQIYYLLFFIYYLKITR